MTTYLRSIRSITLGVALAGGACLGFLSCTLDYKELRRLPDAAVGALDTGAGAGGSGPMTTGMDVGAVDVAGIDTQGGAGGVGGGGGRLDSNSDSKLDMGDVPGGEDAQIDVPLGAGGAGGVSDAPLRTGGATGSGGTLGTGGGPGIDGALGAGGTGGSPCSARDCTSAADNNCNGTPDNQEAACTACPVGTSQACTTGKPGICSSGKQRCQVAADHQSAVWGTCDPTSATGKRDCKSSADNDCDGKPDNTVDTICQCSVDGTQACDSHAGLDGHGPCKAGSQTCVASADKSTSAWGACTDAVGPAAADSCNTTGDDANCNGVPNEGCPCVNGTTQPCGPTNPRGVCKAGTSTCTNAAWGTCTGAVYAGLRDCTSSADNNCDGTPDNTVDSVCLCAVGGSPRSCGEHTGKDGYGPCKAGSQTCLASVDKSTSNWGTCTGSVGPGQRNCLSSIDNDCNGALDNSETAYCGCPTPSGARACVTGQPGICSSGTQTCNFAPDNTTSAWGSCSGASAGTRDCRSTADNNCNGTPDKQESSCGCPTANATQSCSTGLSGVCAAGTQTCVFASDNASSGWSTCTGAAPGLRNCASSADNNCNGTADNAESTYCKCATSGAPQTCNSHPGYDGVGTCKSGTQTCVFAANSATSDWGPCSGDVGPVADEGCGPNQPDANCNGKAGDGNSSNCTTTINISQAWDPATSQIDCADGALHASNYASTGTGCPNDDCTVISTFKVFKTQVLGTEPLHNCRWQVAGGPQYHTFATVRSGCNGLFGDGTRVPGYAGATTDLGVVGYVSTVAATGYRRLKHGRIRCSWYGNYTNEEIADTPMTSCPGCVSSTACTDSPYYVLP